MEKTDFRNLIKQVKKAPVVGVTQKITPVKKSIVNETQFSFYIDKGLLKQVKLKAIEEGISIKSIINRSINHYLEN